MPQPVNRRPKRKPKTIGQGRYWFKHDHRHIAEKLAEARRFADAGYTTEKIAEKLAISTATLHRWRKAAREAAATVTTPGRNANTWAEEALKTLHKSTNADARLEALLKLCAWIRSPRSIAHQNIILMMYAAGYSRQKFGDTLISSAPYTTKRILEQHLDTKLVFYALQGEANIPLLFKETIDWQNYDQFDVLADVVEGILEAAERTPSKNIGVSKIFDTISNRDARYWKASQFSYYELWKGFASAAPFAYAQRHTELTLIFEIEDASFYEYIDDALADSEELSRFLSSARWVSDRLRTAKLKSAPLTFLRFPEAVSSKCP